VTGGSPLPPPPPSPVERAFASLLRLGPEGLTIGRNSGWLLGDRMFRLLVGLVVNAWLVRYLGAARFGLLSFAQSVVVIAGAVGALGLETILVRDLVREPGREAALLGTALRLRATAWLGTLAVAVALTTILRHGDRESVVLALILSATALAQAFDIVDYWFQSRARVAPVVVARLVVFVASSAAKIVAIRLHAPLTTVAILLAAEVAASAVALLVAYGRAGRSAMAWRFEAPLAMRLLSDSWPLILNGAAIVVSVRVDQMILTAARGTAENGFYAAAQRLCEVVYYVPVAVMAAATPILFRSHQTSREDYAHRLQRVLAMLALAGLAAAVTVSLGAPWIVRLLFGQAFARTAPVLALLIWAAPALFMGVAQANWFIVEGRQRELMLRSIVAALISLALNLTLAPAYGAWGSALAMVVSQTFAYWILNVFFADTRPLFRMQCRALVPFPVAR
jgi:PST family polysaccharide transporter